MQVAGGGGDDGGAVQLLGRDRECRVLRSVLDTLRTGHGATLVVRGPIGVGKTRLLAYVEECASDCVVTRASGAESERELAYAGLQMICASMLTLVGQLPIPQRDALRVALGLAPGPAP